MQSIIFQHTLIVSKYFQTPTNNSKFIHSKYITDNNGELKNIKKNYKYTILYFEYT